MGKNKVLLLFSSSLPSLHFTSFFFFLINFSHHPLPPQMVVYVNQKRKEALAGVFWITVVEQ